jgi:hypothetical protein
MTTPTDKNRDPSVPPHDAPPRGGEAKKVPPLAWIILALLVLMAVIGAVQYQGNHKTPGGGDTPMAQVGDPAEAVMPATPPPATGNDAPAP